LLLGFLERKFNDVGMDGITSSQQLKNAWGDYLETLGGSLSALDGVKKGFATFFTGIAADSKAMSKEQIKHIYDIQENMALFAYEAAQRFKQVLTVVGGFFVTTFGLMQDTFNGFRMALKNVGFSVLNIFNGLASIAPRAMEAITGVSNIKDAWQGLKDDFSTNNDKLSGIELFGASTQKNIKNWIATFSNANATIATGTKDIKDFYDAQRKLLDSNAAAPLVNNEGIDTPATGDTKSYDTMLSSAQSFYDNITSLNATELESVRKKYADMMSQANEFYAQKLLTDTEYSNAINEIGKAESAETTKLIADQATAYQKAADDLAVAKRAQIEAELDAELDAERQAIETMKQLSNDKLSAQLAYMQAVKPLSQEYLDAQISAYQTELDAYRNLGLSKVQIDEMVNAKRAELTRASSDATIAEWERSHSVMSSGIESFVNVFSNQMANMVAIETNSNNAIVKSFTAAINSMISEISRYISKLIIAFIFKKLAFGLGGGGGMGGLGSGDFGIPMPNIASVGGSNGQGVGFGGFTQNAAVTNNNLLIAAITDLRAELRDAKTQNFNLYMDGMPLRNALKRTERNVNALGAS